MHLDEVECVVRELIGYLVPLHGWSAGTVARPANGEEGGEGDEESGLMGGIKMLSKRRKKKILYIDGIGIF